MEERCCTAAATALGTKLALACIRGKKLHSHIQSSTVVAAQRDQAHTLKVTPCPEQSREILCKVLVLNLQ